MLEGFRKKKLNVGGALLVGLSGLAAGDRLGESRSPQRTETQAVEPLREITKDMVPQAQNPQGEYKGADSLYVSDRFVNQIEEHEMPPVAFEAIKTLNSGFQNLSPQKQQIAVKGMVSSYITLYSVPRVGENIGKRRPFEALRDLGNALVNYHGVDQKLRMLTEKEIDNWWRGNIDENPA